MYFSFDGYVRYSETDEKGKLSLTSIMNYLQDVVLFHSEAIGMGPKYLISNNRAWYLLSWQIVIERAPELFEKITVKTSPHTSYGCFCDRTIMIEDQHGEYVVKANSLWVYLDLEHNTFARPDADQMARYGTMPPIEMDYAPRKIALPEEMESREPIKVGNYLLDTNKHVNNVKYVELAREVLEAETLDVRELRVEYKKQARLGDVMYPKIAKEGNWYYVTFENEKGESYSNVALLVKDE